MGFRINTNIGAMNAHSMGLKTNRNLDNALQKLSSGLRINKAADDSSGMAIADSLKAQAKGLGQAIANANDGIGVLQTADGALDEYIGILNTVRTKAIQAASDGQNASTRKMIQSDINKLLEEAQNIAATTSFNGQTLLNGAFKNKSFHIGAYAGESIKIDIDNTQIRDVGKFAFASGSGEAIKGGTETAITVKQKDAAGVEKEVSVKVTAAKLPGASSVTSLQSAQYLVDKFNEEANKAEMGVRASVTQVKSSNYTIRLDSKETFTTSGAANAGIANKEYKAEVGKHSLNDIDVTSREKAEMAVIITDYAIQEVDDVRSKIGSAQNQLESTIRNISVSRVNVTAAESQIRDVDFASESSNFAKNNILAQSGTYALSQANAIQQNVMRLLQ